MNIADIKALAQSDAVIDLISSPGKNNVMSENIDVILGNLYNASIVIGVILGVVIFTVGAFKFSLSETPFVKSDGKTEMSNALIGVLILLLSFLILRAIGITGVFNS